MRRFISVLVLALVTAGTISAQQTGPTVTVLTTPDKVLPTEFTRILGVFELPDGRVLVSDRGEEQVLAADFATGRTAMVGRKGSGPAEYRLPGRLVAWMGDSVMLADQGNARLAIIGPDLRIHRSFVLQVPDVPTTLAPRSVDARGRLFTQIPRWAAGSYHLRGDSIPVIRITGRVVTTVAWVVTTAEPPGQIQKGLPYVPFSPEDGWVATRDGKIAIVRSGDYHVEWISDQGAVVRGPRVPFDRLPVSREDRVAYTRHFLEGSTIAGRPAPGAAPSGESPLPPEWLEQKRVEEIADQNTFAEVKPPITDAAPMISPSGEVWVERSVPSKAPTEWDVFDGRGVRVKRLRLPAERRLVAVGQGVLYAIRVDENGFERLERYRVR